MEVFEYYKSFEHKISKRKYTRFFLWGYIYDKIQLFEKEMKLVKSDM